MKVLVLSLSLSLIPLTDATAAYQAFSVRNRITTVRMEMDGRPGPRWHRTQYNAAYFRVDVVGDDEGLKTESTKNGRPFITAQPDQRFAVRLYNPLPVRVAVNLTIDGLNSISGKPSGIADGEKWMIDPYSTLTIRGWQVATGEARRFFFTNKPKSYAKWSGDQIQKDLSVNCGVIGAAYFWSQAELDRYYDSHPTYQYEALKEKKGFMAENMAGARREMQSSLSESRPAAAADQQLAGTGMGERESNPTTLVDFHYDTGMYQLAQAIVIYYDFATPDPTPNPFPAISYAPEMP